MNYKIMKWLLLLIICSYKCGQDDIFGQNRTYDLEQLLQFTPRVYICYQTQGEILIDGDLSDPSWMKTNWTEDFTDIEGNAKAKPYCLTRAKLLWDDSCLYIGAEIYDENIWAYFTKHDDPLFLEKDFEFFIDPDNDTKNYIEYETNAMGTIFDLILPKPYRNGGMAISTWDIKNIKQGIKIDGTLNNGNDTDNKWSVEIAIPFKSLTVGFRRNTFIEGQIWRFNFLRVEWQAEFKNGKYEKKTNPATNKPVSELNWAWSPVGIINMHFPERWGYLKFSAFKAGNQKDSLVLPETEKLKQALWTIYYFEMEYYSAHKEFTSKAEALFPQINKLYNPKLHSLIIETTTNQFEARIENINKTTLMWINQNGELHSE